MGSLEKFAAKDHGDDLHIAQLRSEAAVPYGPGRRAVLSMFFDPTVHRHDKSIAVHWWSPCIGAVARQLF